MARILIVEDNEDLAKLISRKFALEGFEVRTILDGASAMREVRQFEPEIILLDLLIPGGGGLSFLEKLKLSQNTNQIPVIVLTCLENDEYERRARKLGVTSYLKKPCEEEQIIAEVKKILKIKAP